MQVAIDGLEENWQFVEEKWNFSGSLGTFWK